MPQFWSSLCFSNNLAFWPTTISPSDLDGNEKPRSPASCPRGGGADGCRGQWPSPEGGRPAPASSRAVSPVDTKGSVKRSRFPTWMAEGSWSQARRLIWGSDFWPCSNQGYLGLNPDPEDVARVFPASAAPAPPWSAAHGRLPGLQESGEQCCAAFDRRIGISFWTDLSQVNPRKSWWPKITQKQFSNKWDS